jgi:hypothetical protein
MACVGAALVAIMGLSGCESGCNEQTVERAQRFLESHQSCDVDADCVIVDDFCGEIPGGETHCGQLTMNRQGEQSGEWKRIKEDLGDCAPSECARCLSLRGTGCTNGSCGGP